MHAFFLAIVTSSSAGMVTGCGYPSHVFDGRAMVKKRGPIRETWEKGGKQRRAPFLTFPRHRRWELTAVSVKKAQ